MSNIHPIHLPANHTAEPEDRLEQACAWVARLDRGLSADEEQQLKLWCAEHPANRREFLAAAKEWDKMDALSRLSDLFPEQAALRGNDQSGNDHSGNDSNLDMRGVKPLRQRLKNYALAASVTMLAVLAGLLVQRAPLSDEPVGQIASQMSYETGVGENSTIELPDHSKLVLNTNSFVVVHYSAKSRIIELQRGELTIDVAHDTSRPLSVLAGGKVIQAVGTAFNVDLRSDNVELIVTEGKVLVAPDVAAKADLANVDTELLREKQLTERLPQTALAISKGERVKLDPKGQKTEQVQKIDQAALAAKLSWKSGNLIFRGEPLEDVVGEISRYTKVQFELADDAKLKQIQVAGLFKTGDVNGLLEVFKNNFNIEAERIGKDKIRLKFKG